MARPVLLVLGVFFVPYHAKAQSSDSSAWYRTIQVNGLVSASATKNFNHEFNTLRVFDIDTRSILIDLFALTLRHDATRGSAGFRFDLDAGPYIPKVIHSAGLDATGNLDITQAYLSYDIAVGRGLTVDIGKFITPAGYEYIERFDGQNDNFSHSFLFGYAIPFTHTGLRLTYPFSSEVTVGAMVVNGWDNTVDNNLAKTVGATFSWTPATGYDVIATGIVGPEQAYDNSSTRRVIDLIGDVKLSEVFAIGVNGDYGSEEGLAATEHSQDVRTSVWLGAAGYLKANFADQFSLALRAEVFEDRDGTRTGTAQTVHEYTLTPAWKPDQHFVLRADLRYDWSTESVFRTRTGTTNIQPTVSLNALYFF